jgi:hypothetical protein
MRTESESRGCKPSPSSCVFHIVYELDWRIFEVFKLAEMIAAPTKLLVLW